MIEYYTQSESDESDSHGEFEDEEAAEQEFLEKLKLEREDKYA